MYDSGLYRMDTTGKSLAMKCRSHYSAPSSARNITVPRMYLNYLGIKFFYGDSGSKNELLKLYRAGTYKGTHTFTINTPAYSQQLVVNTTVIIEPAMDAVIMPSAMKLDIRKENGMLHGAGSVFAEARGSLGQRLRIEPRSMNGGKLTSSSTAIPYTLDVFGLEQGRETTRLIDGNTATIAPAEFKLYEAKFSYPLRFDAKFTVPVATTNAGRYSDKVTLLFTTSDIP